MLRQGKKIFNEDMEQAIPSEMSLAFAGTAVFNSFNDKLISKRTQLSDSRRGKRGAQRCELFAPSEAVCIWPGKPESLGFLPSVAVALFNCAKATASYVNKPLTASALPREGGSQSQNARFFFSFFFFGLTQLSKYVASYQQPALQFPGLYAGECLVLVSTHQFRIFMPSII